MSKYDMSKRGKAEKEASNYSVFDWSKAGKDVEFFKPVEGTNKFDIIPYTISSKKHPLVASGDLEVGDFDYSLEYWVHKNIGPQKKSVVCPNRMYGQHCAICDAGKAFKDDHDDKSAKACWPSLRVAYNVRTKDGKIQIFDVSNHLFGKQFKSLQNSESEDGVMFLAADVENGKQVVFQAEKVKKDGMEFLEFSGMSFKDRKNPVTDEDVENTVSLDACLITYTSEQVLTLYEGGSVHDDEDDEKPAKAKKLADDDDDDEPPTRKPKKPVDDDDEEDEKPKAKAKKDDEDDDKPSDKPKCFGKKWDELEACEDCKSYRECMKAQSK